MSSDEEHQQTKSSDEECLQIKTSDEEYIPDEESLDGRRRSKRISQSVKKLRSSSLRDEKATEKEPARKKRKVTKAKKDKENHTSREETNIIFSSDSLTSAELNQLYIKYKRDGHFRFEEQNPSYQPAFKSAKGNLQKKKQAKQSSVALNKNDTSMDGNLSQKVVDCSLVTVCNPLPNASGSTLYINPGSQTEYDPTFQMDYYKNWSNSRIMQNFPTICNLQVSTDLQQDSTVTSILSSHQHTQVLNNEKLEAFNIVNSSDCGYDYLKKNAEYRYEKYMSSTQADKQLSTQNVKKPCENFTAIPPDTPNIYDHYNQSNNLPSLFQSGKMPMENCNASQSQNSYKRVSTNWHDLSTLNNFSSGNASTKNLLNTQNCISETPFTNYASGVNANSTMNTIQSEYYSSLPLMINGTANYSMAYNSPACSQYFVQPNNFIVQMPCNQPSNKYNDANEFTNDKENREIVNVSSSTPVATKSSAIDEWIRNSQADKDSQIFDGLPDDDEYFCATVSSMCSYDDDVTYSNLAYNFVYNDNSCSTSTTLNDELTKKVFTEMNSGPTYDE